MTRAPEPMVEIHRGPFLESQHMGHAVICDATGGIVEAWGDPDAVVLPRSSAKMLQALPMLTSGAAEAFGIGADRMALACASHQGAPIHVEAVTSWLSDLGLSEADLLCGPEASRDKDLRFAMIRDGLSPTRIHNNCSGKHCGFLTVNKHLGGDPNYVDPNHPVQQQVRAVFEELTQVGSTGYGLDGCSAPNFGTTMHGMARAMAFFATAAARDDVTSRAAAQMVEAMIAYPELVAGETRACTHLMRAAKEPVAIKTGAEGYFIAILPNRGMGVALKILDGATRASNCAIAALLVRLDVLDAEHPEVTRFLNPPIKNWAGLVAGEIRPAPGLTGQAA